MIEKRTLYFTMVLYPGRGWCRNGGPLSSRRAAEGWLGFVRAANRWLCPVRVSQFTLRLIDGVMDERSVRILSEKFNMDPPDSSCEATGA